MRNKFIYFSLLLFLFISASAGCTKKNKKKTLLFKKSEVLLIDDKIRWATIEKIIKARKGKDPDELWTVNKQEDDSVKIIIEHKRLIDRKKVIEIWEANEGVWELR